MRGKRVEAGAPGSGSEIISWLILQHNGITRNDITSHLLKFREMVEAFEQNLIDVAFTTQLGLRA